MNSAKEVAKYIVFAYETNTGAKFENSELKLQKLLYLSQRESFCLTGKKLISDDFIGWVHGPVIPSIRYFFEEDYTPLTSIEETTLSEEDIYVVNNTLAQYGMYEAWYLRNLTHEETSWINSRNGLKSYEKGHKKLNDEDIKKDAEKIRIYDHIFDMYVDEFEDLTEDEMSKFNE